jgi:hypothetical protein
MHTLDDSLTGGQDQGSGFESNGSSFGARWVRPSVLIWCLLAVYGLAALATVSARGIPWDEPSQSQYGQSVLSWYSSGFQDRTAVDRVRWDLVLYGAAVEAPLEGIASLVGGDRYLTRHVLLVLFSLLGLLGTYLLGARLAGPWVGLLAAFLLAASPRFFAHAAFNSKDVPFAVLYIWGLLVLARDLGRDLTTSLRSAVPLGLVTGLLLGIRVGGVIIFLPILVGFVARWWTAEREARRLAFLGLRMGLVFLFAWGLMILAWPWGQLAPIGNPITALEASAQFPHRSLELFGGELVTSGDLPLSYLPGWLYRTAPEATLIGLALAVTLLVFGKLPLKRFLQPVQLSAIVALGLPLLMVVLGRANLYDGARHFFFIQPLLAIGAAAGVVGAVTRVPRWLSLGVLGVVGAAAVITFADAARLYPYEHVYFNRISGGLPAAEGQLELDYWGLSYREGAEWLNQNVPDPSGTAIASCSRPESTAHFLSDDFNYLGSHYFGVEEFADFVLFTVPHDCGAMNLVGTVAYEVKREGVTLLTVVAAQPGEAQGSGQSD